MTIQDIVALIEKLNAYSDYRRERWAGTVAEDVKDATDTLNELSKVVEGDMLCVEDNNPEDPGRTECAFCYQDAPSDREIKHDEDCLGIRLTK